MKNISEIDTEQYAYYAFTKCKTNAQVWSIHPEGDALYENCDLFSCGDYTIVAFGNSNTRTPDNAFRITSDEGSDYIQADPYEKNYDFINNDYNKENTVFFYMDSVSMPLFLESGRPMTMHSDRCDLSTYGPVPFILQENGLNEPKVNQDYHQLSNNVKLTSNFFGSSGDFHVIRIEWKDYPDSAYKNVGSMVGIARTFIGLVKMIIEWADTTKEPWNNDERFATAAVNGLINIGIPQEVIDEINDYQIDMPIKLFLQNDPNCRGTLDEKVEFPPLFKKWFLSKIRYESLNSLYLRNPIIAIPNETLEQEKKNMSKLIYEFFLFQGVNIETKSTSELIELIESGQFNSDLDGFKPARNGLYKIRHI